MKQLIFKICDKYRTLPILMLLIGGVYACEKSIDWELKTQLPNTIVVEAMLTNQLKTQEIKLSKPFTDLNAEPTPLRGATVKVILLNDTILFNDHDTHPGLYKSEKVFAASLNRVYRLHIKTDTSIYISRARMAPIIAANKPTFTNTSDSGFYRIQWNNSPYHPYHNAMYSALISWGHLPQFQNRTDTAALLYHYTISSLHVSHIIFPQDQEKVSFPGGSKVIFTQYSLNKEFADFLKAFLSETQWQGSLFEEARGNLPSNISNGGLGYFTASYLKIDTLWVK